MKKGHSRSSIETPQPPAVMTGTCKATLDEQADAVSVVFTVVGEDRERVKELVLSHVGWPTGNAQTQARGDPKETGLIIQAVTPASSVTADLEVVLAPGKPSGPVRIDVVSEYFKRGAWWRFKRCAFDHYP